MVLVEGSGSGSGRETPLPGRQQGCFLSLLILALVCPLGILEEYVDGRPSAWRLLPWGCCLSPPLSRRTGHPCTALFTSLCFLLPARPPARDWGLLEPWSVGLTSSNTGTGFCHVPSDHHKERRRGAVGKNSVPGGGASEAGCPARPPSLPPQVWELRPRRVKPLLCLSAGRRVLLGAGGLGWVPALPWTPGRFGASVAIGLTIFVLFIVTIIVCFTCSCCSLYKMCRRPRRKHPRPSPRVQVQHAAGRGDPIRWGWGRGDAPEDPDSPCSHRDHHHCHHRGARPLPTACEHASQLPWASLPGLPAHASAARAASCTLPDTVPATLPSPAHGPSDLPRDTGW